MWNHLCQSENRPLIDALRRELQLSEGMLEQMMSEMEASRYTYELGKYEKVLRLDLSSPPLLQSQYAVPFAGQLAFGKPGCVSQIC